MTDFLDVISFRDRGEGNKPFPQRIGSAKKRDDGGLDIYLDALPAPSLDRNGKLQIHMRVSERQQRQGTGGYGTRQTGGTQQRRDTSVDDDLPPW